MTRIKVHDADYPFDVVGLVEDIQSLIWTERYNDVGEFELQVRMTKENYELLSFDRQLSITDTPKRMIIESHEIKEDLEAGTTLLILKGRSLEAILSRRVVLNPMYVYDTIDVAIKELIDDNIISTAYTPRNIPHFTYQVSTNEFVMNSRFGEGSTTFWGEEILEIIVPRCQVADVGFELIVDSSDDFVFSLYAGLDRTIYQTDNSALMFSKAFDNLKETSYFETKEHYKTDTLVVGQIATEVAKFPPTWLVLEEEGNYIPGLAKRETFTDASDLNRYTENNALIPLMTYSEKYMQARGKDDLLNNKKVYEYFEATVDIQQLTYRTDYALGDLISYRDSAGNVGTAIIAEITISEDLTGRHVYPILAIRPSDHYSVPNTLSRTLLVGGGGGGGGNSRGGGGGAGEVLYTIISLAKGETFDVVVGAGGTGVTNGSGNNGGDSSFAGEYAYGGGGGGLGGAGAAADGADGGNGGGGGGSTGSTNGLGGDGVHQGGEGSNGPTNYGGGGGGGGSEDGHIGYSGTTLPGQGGAGLVSDITGSNVTYGGGGGGYGSTSVGAGGTGGGGNANNSGNGYAGTNGLGGGGGAGTTKGGNGGSGVVILRILTSLYTGTYTGSPTITTDGAFTILKFTAAGSYTTKG